MLKEILDLTHEWRVTQSKPNKNILFSTSGLKRHLFGRVINLGHVRLFVCFVPFWATAFALPAPGFLLSYNSVTQVVHTTLSLSSALDLFFC